jgi:hypothetical protein
MWDVQKHSDYGRLPITATYMTAYQQRNKNIFIRTFLSEKTLEQRG